MEQIKTYCQMAANSAANNVHRIYHDSEYGFPIEEDNELFGRLLLEINQAGLSWTTILNKKVNFRNAYANFDIYKIAHFTEADRARLMDDAGIIRNKLKINAAIHNAQKIIEIQQEFGSFKDWLDFQFPKQKEAWVKLFKKTFKFTGGEITNEFLMSTGYLKGAHEESCPIYQKVIDCKPKYLEV